MKRLRKAVALGVGALLVGAVVGSVATRQVALGEPAPVSAGSAAPTATVTDEQQVARITLPTSSVPSWTSKVEAAEAGVLTSIDITAGRLVRPCGRLGSVNDRAVMALPGEVPLYRALSKGDKGGDVTRLQVALRECGRHVADNPGTFGADTVAALRGLSGRSSIDPSTAVWIPSGRGDVEVMKWSGKVGSQVDAGSTLVQLSSVTKNVVAELDDPDEDRLKAGDRGTVTSTSGKSAKVVVVRVDAPAASGQGEEDKAAGEPQGEPLTDSDNIAGQPRRVVLAWDEGPVSDASEATWVVARSRATDLSVPLGAITSCGGTGSCVTVVAGNTRTAVPVLTTVVGDTGVAVRPAKDGRLSVGDVVELTAPR